MQTQEPGQGAEPVIPQPEPPAPAPEPVTPPSEPLNPGREPGAPVPEPGTPPIHAEGVPVPLDHPVAQQLAIARTSLEETREAMLAAEADLDNIRRRVLDDISRARKYAIEGFAQAVLPVRDSLETALQVDTPSVEAAREGLVLTLRQLEAAFARNKLVEIDPAPGDRLDPALHKAISMVPAPQSANTVVSVLQKGYCLGDRLLRPALVTVAEERGA